MKKQKEANTKKLFIYASGMMSYFVVKAIAEMEKERGNDNIAEFLTLLNERLNCGIPDRIFKMTKFAVKINKKIIRK